MLLDLQPVPDLLRRVRAELAASFIPGRPMRISRAPGRLDVMGGIADYTGSLVCEMPLDRAAAVAMQSRDDRQVQVFSFNLLDDHRPFTLSISLDSLAAASIDSLRANFAEPGRRWAGYLVGCLAILHQDKLIDLADPKHTGLNIALLSTVPLGGGVSSSAAIEVATMMNLLDHLGLRESRTEPISPMLVAAMCQRVENHVVGAPCGIMDQATSCAGRAGTLMRMICQPHELQSPLPFPAGVGVVGINSNVKHSVGGGAYGRTRVAAFMAHRIILETMRSLGTQSGHTLTADPMNGYLANLDPRDYKQLFRPRLPESLSGAAFIAQYQSTIDTVTTIDPNTIYPIQAACDHHVLEARRVRDFAGYLEQAATLPIGSPPRKLALDKAGHLMYASHISYGDCAGLGAPECDLLVDLVRSNEAGGLYGAKITGGGSGGTVAVLCEASEGARATIARIMETYRAKTGLVGEWLEGSSPGAWESGTQVVVA